MLAIIASILVSYPIMPAGASSWNVSSVQHSPAVPKSGETVNVTLTLQEGANVSFVRISVCTLAPTYKCDQPINMSRSSSNSNEFAHQIKKNYNPGWQVGFKFRINYTNSSPEDFPKSQGDSNYHEVEGPIQELFYFSYTLEAAPSDDSLLIYALVAFVIVDIVIIAVYLAFRAKKTKAAKGPEKEKIEKGEKKEGAEQNDEKSGNLKETKSDKEVPKEESEK